MTRKLVVIGGIAAGLSAASKVKRLLRGLDVTVYEMSGFASTGACGLPYFVGGNVEEARNLLSMTVEDLGYKRGISVLTQHEVLAIDQKKRIVEIINHLSGKKFTDTYV